MMAMGMSPMGMSAAMCHMDCGPKMSMHGHHLPTQVYPTSAYDRTTGHPVFSLPPILELRKEKSRDAARSRRGKENYEFYELAKMLPLPGAITSQLDKASIIRLTISYLKLKDFSSHGDPPWNRDGASPMSKTLKGQSSRRRPGVMEVYDAHQGTHILQSLDGFAFALSSDGRFLYISETVSIYLGLSQVEMTGSSIFEYVHDGDKAELSDQLGLCWPPRADSSGLGSPSAHSDDSNPSAPPPRQPTPPIEKVLLSQSLAKGYERAFCIRMKSTLTKRGVHVKSSGYRVVQLLTRIRPQFSFSITRKHPATVLGTVGVAIALPPPTISELFIDNDMFVTRLAPDLKTIYCEPRISDLMDLSSEDLTSRSLYEFCHAADLAMLRQCHNALLNKGQVLTEYYRLMNKHGGYVWVQTCATTICSAKNAEDQNIIAINYVLSGIENGGCVLNMNQLQQMDPTQLEHHNQTLADMRSEMDQYERHHSSTPETRGPTCQPVMLSDKAALHNTTGLVGEGADDVPPMIGPHENVRPVDQLNGPSSPPPLSPATSHGYKDGPDGGTTYDNYLTDKQRYDNKNSRRKNDRPRKRKRESESEEAGAIAGGGGGDGEKRPHGNEGRDDDGDGGDDSASRDMYDGNTSPQIVPPASSSSPPAKRRSPAPQDLSVKASDDVSINDSDVTMHHGGNGDKGVDIAGDNAPRATTTSAVTEATSTSGGGGGGGSGGTATADSRDKWLSHSTTQCTLNGETHHTYTNASEGGATSSVRDLEEVMNKHLPALGTDAEQLRSTYDSNSSSIDYNYNKHKSLIQWSGSQSPSNSGETLPATNLLRSLYANRESVIRSNVYNPRPQYYNDTAAAHTLLTPPGSSGTDPYKDNVGSSSGSFSSSGSTSSNAAAAAAAAAAASQLNPKSSPVGSYLPYGSGVGSGGGLSVSMPPGMSDSYNITPPASVSPQDKYYSHGSIDPCSNDVYRHYATGGAGSDSLTLPLKPHAYPLPAHTAGGYERTMNAQYAAVGSYYGHGGFYGSTAAPSPAHYHEVAKNGVWS